MLSAKLYHMALLAVNTQAQESSHLAPIDNAALRLL
jgi:hypothetical protein